jgi:vacuolar-type H+-ATPase subunit H
VDVQAKLDEITALVEAARAMPMSASCMINRGELLAHLDELRDMLPAELSEAAGVLRERSAVVEEGRDEAARIVAEAEAERARLVAKTEVVREAAKEADRIVAEARVDADRMRTEVDDYVDAKLANFEVVLNKTLAAVERGRAKLGGQDELHGLRDAGGFDDTPLPG